MVNKHLLTKALSKKTIDIDGLSLDDPEVYKLLQRCDTTGVFQLESEV